MMPEKGFNYQSVTGDYQEKAIKEGPRLQRFWHRGKLVVWDEVIAAKVQEDNQKPIMEIGCGAGLLLQHLYTWPALSVGLDINLQSLIYVKNRISNTGRKNLFLPIASYGEFLPFPINYFGGIIICEVLEHSAFPQKMIQEVFRVLRPGGWCYVTTPNYHSIWPFVEKIVDLTGKAPKMEGEQHISKFNRDKLISLMKDWQVEEFFSFYHLSPFLSFFSEQWGISELKWECQKRTHSGMLLACFVRKTEP
jgi:SAM-dependent methyltransferase